MLNGVVTNDKSTASGTYKTAIEFVNSVGDPSSIDLHLVRDSAKNRDCCVDKVTQTPVQTDFDGSTRPQGPASDIGAHEVQ